MATVEEIQLPDIGDFKDVEVIEILVAPGDQIRAEQSLLALESDKATIEIPSPKAGSVNELLVKVGDRVSRGTPILLLATEEATASTSAPTPAATAAPKPSADPAPETASQTNQPSRPAQTGRQETIAVVLPPIGDFSDIPVVEILVAPGDRVAAEQSLLALESDKATMEIPSPQAGIVEELTVQIGDRLSAGDLILTLRTDGVGEDSGTVPTAPPLAQPVPMPPESEPTSQLAPGETERRQAPVPVRPDDLLAVAKGRRAHASPAIRRFARELGVDLGGVKGSGPKGRILKDDVQNYVKQRLTQAPTPAAGTPLAFAPAPEVDHSRFGPIEVRELPRIQKISGRHLHRCWVGIPHVTQFDEADITELEAFRKGQNEAARDGLKLTFLPFLLKAVAVALERMPRLKTSLSADGEQLILKRYTHIGVAVNTPNGLVVPVLRDVDTKGLATLATELAAISAKARDGKLLPGDMQGGCFTISSLGGIGGTAFTPIINAPEVAILGVSKSEMKPVWDGNGFAPRLMLPLSLSYDHRVVDGAEGARFTTLLSQLLGDIRRLLL